MSSRHPLISSWMVALLTLALMGCGGAPRPPQLRKPPSPTQTRVMRGAIAGPTQTSAPPRADVAPSLSPTPRGISSEGWLSVGSPPYGLFWRVPREWYAAEGEWPSPNQMAVLLAGNANDEQANSLMASGALPRGVMLLRVYAIEAGIPSARPPKSRTVSISGRPGWMQEVAGDPAMPFAWRARLWLEGTAAYGYNYILEFGCAPPTGADAAEQAAFVASCRGIWDECLAGVQVLKEPRCRQGPTPTPGPITWRRVSDDWYKYAFEVPSGWLEMEHVTADRLVFLSDPAVYGGQPGCPFPNGLIKLDFAADPPPTSGPDLTGWKPTTVSGRQAWLQSAPGDEAGPDTSWISAYIVGSEYHYSLSLGCTPPSPEESGTFGADCQNIVDHILASFQVLP